MPIFVVSGRVVVIKQKSCLMPLFWTFKSINKGMIIPSDDRKIKEMSKV